MEKIFIKPSRPGLVVRIPGYPNRTLAAGGEWVNKTAAWVRRLRDGSVIEAEPPKRSKK